MNGKKSKLIRKRAQELQIEWINSLLTDDEDKLTPELLDKALPDQEYFFKNGTIYLSYMNHKWIEKKLKKDINLKLKDLINSNA
tara:strand:- start:138 stop:389 length:252 start_codon:yes stop_codon:yes gene_type:complete